VSTLFHRTSLLESSGVRPPTARTLHVVNGDVTAEGLQESGVAGRISVSADVLYEGPAPAGLTPERWRRVRAQFLAESGYEGYEQALARLSGWDRAVEAYRSYDEVVLWFEHDLFDQLLLIRLLAWFGAQEMGLTGLSLISIGEHPEIPRFVSLGQLLPRQLAVLPDERRRITQEQLDLGRDAWRAFCSPDPLALAALLSEDTSALPFLAGALHRHFEELPSVWNGLPRTEHQALSATAAGPTPFPKLFRAVQEMEERAFMTDLSFAQRIRQLAIGPRALLRLDPPGTRFVRHQTVSITPAGLDALDGREDWVRLRGFDRWLGGVHLEGREAAWRWDTEAERLVAGVSAP
jgi:hypothetical protein